MELLVKASLSKTKQIQHFRNDVNQRVLKRTDAFFKLLDTLTVAGRLNSPAALSETYVAPSGFPRNRFSLKGV